ncbi:MAG: hypothetical protein WAT12_01555 [Candidatus Nitrotoga sp.]
MQAPSGRYLLFIDVLGFSELVQTQGAESVYAVVDEALSVFSRWEELNQLFKTIYFSDTFIFYQEPEGYGDWAFLDVYAIGGMVLSALLAKGIPARGAITFGEFVVRQDALKKHQVYFGKALIEAYRAEQRENWIGITIQPSAWRPYELKNPGIVGALASEGVWIKRSDDVLLLSPFIKLRGWYPLALIGEVDEPYLEWNEPEFPNELRALRYLVSEANKYAMQGDFTSKIASKYHATVRFCEQILGKEQLSWALAAARE